MCCVCVCKCLLKCTCVFPSHMYILSLRSVLFFILCACVFTHFAFCHFVYQQSDLPWNPCIVCRYVECQRLLKINKLMGKSTLFLLVLSVQISKQPILIHPLHLSLFPFDHSLYSFIFLIMFSFIILPTIHFFLCFFTFYDSNFLCFIF